MKVLTFLFVLLPVAIAYLRDRPVSSTEAKDIEDVEEESSPCDTGFAFSPFSFFRPTYFLNWQPVTTHYLRFNPDSSISYSSVTTQKQMNSMTDEAAPRLFSLFAGLLQAMDKLERLTTDQAAEMDEADSVTGSSGDGEAPQALLQGLTLTQQRPHLRKQEADE